MSPPKYTPDNFVKNMVEYLNIKENNKYLATLLFSASSLYVGSQKELHSEPDAESIDLLT